MPARTVYDYVRVGAPSPEADAKPAPLIRFGEGGKVEGIDGMLDQVSAALVRQASKDTALHQGVGDAAGVKVSIEVGPWLAVGAAALATVAFVSLVKPRARTRQIR